MHLRDARACAAQRRERLGGERAGVVHDDRAPRHDAGDREVRGDGPELPLAHREDDDVGVDAASSGTPLRAGAG